MNIVILGCGVVGCLAGAALSANGHQVLGVRRRALAHGHQPFSIITGDASDPTLFTALASALTRIDAVLITGNPGLRRGRDNGLEAAAALVDDLIPDCRLVYTGSTAVYADAQAGGVDETAAIRLDDAAIAGLMRIETAVAKHAPSLVLRAAALVGPTRTHAQERLRESARLGQPCLIPGDADRPFSYLHEQDLAELCVEAALGGLGTGVLNAAAPQRLTVGEYYLAMAKRAGVVCTVSGDESPAPRRWIDAGKLHALQPDRRWRSVLDV